MAGTFTAKTAQGQIASSSTAVLSPSGVTEYLKKLVLYNTGATQETATVHIDNSGALQIAQYILQSGESAVVDEIENQVLTTGVNLKLGTTNATTVNWFLAYVEES